MATPAYDALPDSTPPSGAAGRLPSGWGERIRRLVVDVRHVARDHVELVVLEAQRASQVLVRTIAAAVVASVLVATAWLGIVVALVIWLAEAVELPIALLIGAGACLAAAGVIVWWVMKHLPEMMFAATLRQLRATAHAEDQADHDDHKDDKS